MSGSHTTYKHFDHKFAGAPKYSNIVLIAFLIVRYIHSARPFSSEVQPAAPEILIPSTSSSFVHLTYSLPPSRRICHTRKCVRRSNQCAYFLNSSAAIPLVSLWHAPTHSDASSINVTKHMAPPTDGTFISVTSVCSNAPGCD